MIHDIGEKTSGLYTPNEFFDRMTFMRRNILDNVKIVEPPLEELVKGRSGWKRSCAAGCGCVVVLLIGAVIFVRVFTGPGPQTLKTAPPNFPKDIEIYDAENMEKITFISGRYKNRSIEIAALFPKVILSPLLLALNKDTEATTSTAKGEVLKNIWKIISTPVGDHRDTVQIEWRELDAEPSFVISYYKTELGKKGFTIDVESSGQGVRQFSFSRAVDGVSGSLYAKGDEENRPGTDYAILTVNLPIEK